MSKPQQRVLLISHGYPPFYGGGEHAAACLAQAMAEDRVVCVLTSNIGGRLPGEEQIGNVQIRRVACPKKQWTRHSAFELAAFYWACRRELDGLIKTFRPDCVLAQFAFPAGAVGRWIRRRYGIPYLVSLRGSDVPGYQPGRFGVIYPVYRVLFRSICSKAHCTVAVSEDLAQLAGRSWGGRIEVICNGVDTTRFSPKEDASSSPDDTFTVVSTTQLIERKGLHYLINAIAELAPDVRKKIVLRIYGQGPEQARLAKLANVRQIDAQVYFCGLAQHDEIPNILRTADVYVLPTLQEGLPMALLEAMATGLPIIATAVGGIPSVLEHQHNALLVKPASVDELREAMIKMMADPARRKQLGAAARRSAESMSWATVWMKYRACMPTDGNG